jgi:tripartite-type tricarboxylate transporter receptor subunit TctC
MKDRLLNLIFLTIVLALFLPGPGYSQEEITKFPSRPINFVVALPPGATPDLASRLLAKQAEKYLGQPIIIVNKPGGTFAIGTAAIASSKPDGYTIGCAGYPAMFVVPQIEKLPYHTLKDFKWIMQFGYMNFGVTVKSDSPFKNLKDVIDYARQNPNKLIIGGAGIGGFGHILFGQIIRKEGLKVTYMPYKGGPDTEKALLGGHIHVMTGDINYSLLEAGETRLLILLSENRVVDYPQTPNLKDLGYETPAPTILPIAGPKGIPEGISKKLEEAFTSAMKEQEFISGMKNIKCSIVYRNSKELEDYVTFNYEAFTKLLKDMGLTK